MIQSKTELAAAFINEGKTGFKVELVAGRWYLIRPGDLGRLTSRQEIIQLATAHGWRDREE